MSDLPEARQLLAPDAYTGPAWYEREQETLFGHVWNFAGTSEDLQDAGDYLCVRAGRYPLFVVRQRDGTLRAFHNLCRHRGSQLLEGSGNVRHGIRCFYHRWTYDLEGRLTAVPQRRSQFPDLELDRVGLHPAGLALWRNLIFVHPEPEPEPFDAWLAGLPGKLGPHEFEKLVEVARVKYRVRANWKILIENFIDGYHFFHLHAETLGNGDFTRQAWEPMGRHWAFYRPLKPGVRLDGGPIPVVEGVPPDFGADADVIFPNLALYATATYWLTFQAIPVAPDQSIVDVRMRAMPAVAGADAGASATETPSSPWIEELSGPLARYFVPDPEAHPLDSKDVMLEDIYACEAVQRGMGSPLYRVGAMARDYERALAWFQRNVLDYVAAS